jgi:hypothetical protein
VPVRKKAASARYAATSPRAGPRPSGLARQAARAAVNGQDAARSDQGFWGSYWTESKQGTASRKPRVGSPTGSEPPGPCFSRHVKRARLARRMEDALCIPDGRNLHRFEEERLFCCERKLWHRKQAAGILRLRAGMCWRQGVRYAVFIAPGAAARLMTLIRLARHCRVIRPGACWRMAEVHVIAAGSAGPRSKGCPGSNGQSRRSQNANPMTDGHVQLNVSQLTWSQDR